MSSRHTATHARSHEANYLKHGNMNVSQPDPQHEGSYFVCLFTYSDLNGRYHVNNPTVKPVFPKRCGGMWGESAILLLHHSGRNIQEGSSHNI